jgi:hypothetical protein
MDLVHRRRAYAVDGQKLACFAVGGIWIAGAAFNALVTARMDDPYAWIVDESRIGAYRWFFGEVAGAHPVAWTLALVAGEAVLGVLTLAGGRKARLGLFGGVIFSLFLFFMVTPYTVVMGPYALVLVGLLLEERRRTRVTQSHPSNGDRGHVATSVPPRADRGQADARPQWP